MTGPIPPHLPERLTISLWDFSWWTRAGAGEPFADLDASFASAVERGFNTVRICAAPMYLYGGLDLPDELEVTGLGPTPAGGFYGERTRWYDVAGGYRVALHERLLELFAAARRHDCVVVLSSWEYQQSPSFAADERWWRAIDKIPEGSRLDALAAASIALLRDLDDHGFLDRVAFLELHNEVDFSRVPMDPASIDAGIATVSAAFPAVPVTVSYGKPPHLDMATLPDSLQVGQFHIYSYGVLDALQQGIDLRSTGTAGFPNAALAALLRPGAPSYADYGRPDPWRLEATVITDQMLYGYDQIDPVRWDAWLYNHYGSYRELMLREIESRVIASAAWSRRHDVPVVFGEGWVGYTPLYGTFEEGPVGKELAEHGIEVALEHGMWGTVLTSNAAPNHPLWTDVEWLARTNRRILAA